MITQCFVNAELRQAERAVLNYAWECCLELDQQARQSLTTPGNAALSSINRHDKARATAAML